MGKAIKDSGISLETVERIQAIQKKHGAIEQGYEKLKPEEFMNWHPVGTITWEEREYRINEKLREDKEILLTSSGSPGHLPGTIELSLEAAYWFASFLNGTKCDDTHKSDKIIYKAEKDSFGNVTFTEISSGGFTSDLMFSSSEIPHILNELQEKIRKDP